VSASPMRPAVPSLRPCGVPGCTIRHRPEDDPEPREDSDRLDRGFLLAVDVLADSETDIAARIHHNSQVRILAIGRLSIFVESDARELVPAEATD